jgi:hypothetical protein
MSPYVKWDNSPSRSPEFIKAHSSNRSSFFSSSFRPSPRKVPAAVSNSFLISSSVYASGSRSGFSRAAAVVQTRRVFFALCPDEKMVMS